VQTTSSCSFNRGRSIMNAQQLSPPAPSTTTFTPCSALNKDEVTPCHRPGTRPDRQDPSRSRCPKHHKEKQKGRQAYKALAVTADDMWEETKNTRSVLDIKGSVDRAWLGTTKVWLEDFYATLDNVVVQRRRHTKRFYHGFKRKCHSFFQPVITRSFAVVEIVH
jgi:hypothetical protein